MKKNLWLVIAVLILAVSFVTFGGKTIPRKNVASADNFEAYHTISVTGEGTVEVVPDIGYIDFGISIQKKTASQAMEELSKTSNSIITAIKNFGIKEEDIKTTGISLNPVYQWDKDEKKNVLTGFSATENFKVKTKLEDTGKVIALITNNGANRIYGIYFDSSQAKNLKNKAIAEAMKNAREKAEAALTGTNYKIVGIKTISIQSGYFVPTYKNGIYDLTGSEKGSIPIKGGSISVKATVNVVFIFD